VKKALEVKRDMQESQGIRAKELPPPKCPRYPICQDLECLTANSVEVQDIQQHQSQALL